MNNVLPALICLFCLLVLFACALGATLNRE